MSTLHFGEVRVVSDLRACQEKLARITRYVDKQMELRGSGDNVLTGGEALTAVRNMLHKE